MNEENNERCRVTVIFNDGETQEFILAASASIGGYLAAEAGRSGILYMRGPEESHSIPVRHIRQWKIVPLLNSFQAVMDDAPAFSGLALGPEHSGQYLK